jgi:excisionase family DNA binding protein
MNKRVRNRRKVFVEPTGAPPPELANAPPLAPSLTPAELAKLLKVSRQTVQKEIRLGRIKSVKLGNLDRVPRPEAERLLGVTR